MEDYHVDRPGVEVWQHMKLTGTNHSIVLNIANRACAVINPSVLIKNIQIFFLFCKNDFSWPGGYGGGPPLDPIPNSVVKSSSADGTSS